MLVDTKYKEAKVYFYRMELGKRTDRDVFRRNVLALWDVFDKRDYSQIPELILDDQSIYISAMEKVPLRTEILPGGKVLDTFALMMNLQRINPNEPVSFGDLTMPLNKRLKTLSNELENMQKESTHARELMQQIADRKIGPLVNSPILYDPFRRVLLRIRQNGDLTNNELVRYLKSTFQAPGAYLQIILDGQSTADIDGFDLLTELSYAVASPDNFAAFADNSRSEFKDLAAASDLNSRDVKIIMTGPNLTKKKAKKKVDELLSSHEELDTKKAAVRGIADGSEKEIDFIKNRLRYNGQIQYESKTGITIKDNFNLLSWAYKNRLEFIKERYNLEWD